MRTLLEDLREKARWCYGTASGGALLKTCFADGTAAMFLYRLMQGARRWKLEPLAMLAGKLNAIVSQCVIGRGAQFGPGFVLIHSGGVVINGRVRGGRRIFVEHQVTIGEEKNSCPVLDDDVFIGAGAKIIGPVHVGRGARIGANAVVVRDVPAYATVGGVPARVLKIEPPTSDEERFEDPCAEDRRAEGAANGRPQPAGASPEC